MKFFYIPNYNQELAQKLIEFLAQGYKIVAATGTKDGVQYVLQLEQK